MGVHSELLVPQSCRGECVGVVSVWGGGVCGEGGSLFYAENDIDLASL